jgi:hypothetical protein
MKFLFYPMIVYNQNYFIWCYENNFINVNHNAFEKAEMGFANLNLLFYNISNKIQFLMKKKIDGSIINHDMKIEMLFHIVQHYYYYGEPI